jgi:hypothetical protein
MKPGGIYRLPAQTNTKTKRLSTKNVVMRIAVTCWMHKATNTALDGHRE